MGNETCSSPGLLQHPGAFTWLLVQGEASGEVWVELAMEMCSITQMDSCDEGRKEKLCCPSCPELAEQDSPRDVLNSSHTEQGSSGNALSKKLLRGHLPKSHVPRDIPWGQLPKRQEEMNRALQLCEEPGRLGKYFYNEIGSCHERASFDDTPAASPFGNAGALHLWRLVSHAE